MEIAMDCTLYIKLEDNESIEDAEERLERILMDVGLEYNKYDIRLQDRG